MSFIEEIREVVTSGDNETLSMLFSIIKDELAKRGTENEVAVS